MNSLISLKTQTNVGFIIELKWNYNDKKGHVSYYKTFAQIVQSETEIAQYFILTLFINKCEKLTNNVWIK